MFTAVVILHIVACLFLIFVILIQSSKGAEMGAAFGGSNQTLFGSRGAATFLSKVTTAAAIVFMLTSLSLAIFSIHRGSVMSSVDVPKKSERPLAGPSSGPLTDQPVAPQPAAPGQGDAQTPAPAAEK
jgi:preprotein translocase subunit SecG